jgi:hypothetical protein
MDQLIKQKFIIILKRDIIYNRIDNENKEKNI